MSQQVPPPDTLFPHYRQNIQDFRQDLIRTVSKYAQPDVRKAFWQVANTLLPYLGLWALMIATVVYEWPFWTTLLLTIPAAGFLVRLFILFHDCCHGAFFPSRLANRVLGYITGILTFTPFEDWQRTHIIHHGASGNLDRRGVGDVWTLTVDEYLAASRIKRLGYRLFRNPLILFSVVPLFLFLIIQRFPSPGAKKRERKSVIYTNLAIAALIILMSMTLGFKAYLLIQLPVIFMAATIGMWLFYVQHQYEDVYWARQQNWDLISSGLEGSSYYKLPKVLQWMAGNIGLHHIHHVRANIPNYNLQRCQNEVPLLQTVKPLTLLESFKSLWLNLWDEERQKLVSFYSIRMLPRLKYPQPF
ncbi:MAG: fatty acid desaturase [Methylomicrobium sp.]|nr:fatty acid desaturase [Methylomicrobium sp.]